jgi:hypothetical protein
MPMSAKPPEPALTCSGGAEEAAWIAGLLALLAGKALRPPERTATGYRLHLPSAPKVDSALQEFTRRDKACCPFLNFKIEKRPERVQLDVSGPDGARRLLDACVEFACAARSEAT